MYYDKLNRALTADRNITEGSLQTSFMLNSSSAFPASNGPPGSPPEAAYSTLGLT